MASSRDSDVDPSRGAGGPGGSSRAHAPADIAPLLAAARRNPNLNLGKVVLLDELGRGGMGVVWRGWQEDLRRLVAVKVLPARTDRDLLSRFQREARLASRLRHPNIVPVHDIGEAGGRIWFMMDLVDGVSLDGILRKKAFDLETLLRHVQSMAEALDYAHRNGVVHRDIKPANIMIGSDGTPFLTDFGLAAEVAAQTRLTVTGQVMGTPAYMSPEQARGQEGAADPRTDIYSLGAVLYEGLTGRPPVEGRSMAEVLAAILHADLRRPSEVRPGIPRDVDTICMKCLEREPEKRYATAAALAQDLARVRAGDSIDARPPSAKDLAVRAIRRRPLAAAGVGAGIAAAVALVMVLRATGDASRAREQADAAEAQRRAVLAELADLKSELGRAKSPEQRAEIAERIRQAEERIGGETVSELPPADPVKPPPVEEPPKPSAELLSSAARSRDLAESGDFGAAIALLAALSPVHPEETVAVRAAELALRTAVDRAFTGAEVDAARLCAKGEFDAAVAAYDRLALLADPSHRTRRDDALRKISEARAAWAPPRIDVEPALAALRAALHPLFRDRKFAEAARTVRGARDAARAEPERFDALESLATEAGSVLASARAGAERLRDRPVTLSVGRVTPGAVTETDVALRIPTGGSVTLTFATAAASDLVVLATEAGASPTALGAFLLGTGDFATARAAWRGSPRAAELEELAAGWESAKLEADAAKALADLRTAASARDWKKVKQLLDRAGRLPESRAWQEAAADIADWRESAEPKRETGFAVRPKKTKDGLEWSYDFSTEDQLRDWRAVGTEDFLGLPAFGVKLEKGGLRASNAGMVFLAPLIGEVRLRGEVTILRKYDYPIVGADLRGHGWVMVNDEDSIIRLPRDRDGPWLADMRAAAIGRPVPFEYRIDDRKLTVTWDGGTPLEKGLTVPAHSSYPSLWAAGETEVIWSKIVVSGTLAPGAAEELLAADAALAQVGGESPLGAALTLSDGASLGLLQREDGGTWKPSEGVLAGVSTEARVPATLRFPRPVRNFRLRFRYRVQSGRHASVTIRAGVGWTTFLLPAAGVEWQAAEITAVERHVVCRLGTGLVVKPVEGGDPVEAGQILFQARATAFDLDDIVLRSIEKVPAEPSWAEVYSYERPGKLQGLRLQESAAWATRADGCLAGQGEVGIPCASRNFTAYIFFYSNAGRDTSLRIRVGDALLDEGSHLYANHRLVLRVVGADATAVLDGLAIPGTFPARTGSEPLRIRFELAPVAIRSICVREDR